ncbi:hypothetical protein LCGC14_0384710 [marine sediment metagenome]|uniref:Uncharacterized protein n=1 Tax=marine sediment metagenome TaxID=412755 RepID=A0A0F9T6Z8_9ZZZZ
MAEQHYCEEHQVKFTRRTNKKGEEWYSHPIEVNGQTVGWCNEDGKKVAKLSAQLDDAMLPEHKEVVEKAKASVSSEMTKGEWSEKDRVTRQSIQRQTSLKAAVEWCIAKHATEPVKTAMVLTVASLFESYLENGISVEKKK